MLDQVSKEGLLNFGLCTIRKHGGEQFGESANNLRRGQRYFFPMGKVKVAPSHPMQDTSGTKDRMTIK